MKEALIPHLLKERELERERDALKAVVESISGDLSRERGERETAERKAGSNFWKGAAVGLLVTGSIAAAVFFISK